MKTYRNSLLAKLHILLQQQGVDDDTKAEMYAGYGSILVAYGGNNAHVLERSGIPGHFISLTHKNTPCIQTEIMQEKSASWK